MHTTHCLGSCVESSLGHHFNSAHAVVWRCSDLVAHAKARPANPITFCRQDAVSSATLDNRKERRGREQRVREKPRRGQEGGAMKEGSDAVQG